MKEFRVRRCLSIGAVAARSGIAKSSLCAWEADLCIPRGVELGRVLDFLATTTEERLRVFWTLDRPKIWTELGFPGESLAGYFPTALRRLRYGAGLSLSQVAGHVGLSREAVAKWERGDSAPASSIRSLVCELFQLGADSSSLLFGQCPWANSLWTFLATAKRPPSREAVESQISADPQFAELQILGAKYVAEVRSKLESNWTEPLTFLAAKLG